jgi:hypothetical protein
MDEYRDLVQVQDCTLDAPDAGSNYAAMARFAWPSVCVLAVIAGLVTDGPVAVTVVADAVDNGSWGAFGAVSLLLRAVTAILFIGWAVWLVRVQSQVFKDQERARELLAEVRPMWDEANDRQQAAVEALAEAVELREEALRYLEVATLRLRAATDLNVESRRDV